MLINVTKHYNTDVDSMLFCCWQLAQDFSALEKKLEIVSVCTAVLLANLPSKAAEFV